MTASAADPPACSHSASRPLQLYDPVDETLATVVPLEADSLAACDPLSAPELAAGAAWDPSLAEPDALEVLGVVDV
ncbi:MAG TPA: hypothetical protein VE733_16705, partial [Streptosporangiaceae bacterium]|nr:hypothetical protein [Streptosporangiaceae bacterium]